MPARTLATAFPALTLAALATLSVAACSITDDSFTVSDDVSTLRLDTSEGHIDIDGDDVSKITVDMTLWGGSTKVDWEVDGDVLDIQTDCGGAICAVDYTIRMPRDVFVDANTDDGEIHVRDVVAGALLSTGSGSVHVEDLEGETLDIDTASGSVDGDGLRVADTVVTTGTGSIDLYYRDTPDLVDADTAVGSIDLRVPSGAYDITADTGAGSIDFDDVDDDSRSPHVLNLSTGAGSITVSGY